MASKNVGWIYLISNSAVPGLVKVGFTTRRPEDRARELGGTGLPSDYVVEWSIRVTSPAAAEKAAHEAIKKFHHSKEWFSCSSSEAIERIESAVSRYSSEGIDERIKFLDRLERVANERELGFASSEYQKYLKNESEKTKSSINAVLTTAYLSVLQYRQSYTRERAESDFNLRCSKLGFFAKMSLPTKGSFGPENSKLLASPEWERQRLSEREIERPLREYLEKNFNQPRLGFDEFQLLRTRGRVNFPHTTPSYLAERVVSNGVVPNIVDTDILNSIKIGKYST